jgi:hypothetical protein
MNRILCSLALLVPTLFALPAAGQAGELRAVAGAPEAGIARLTKGGAKLTAPVDIEILPQPDPGPGRRRVRIVARPSVDATSLSIEVAAESGLSLAAPVTWTFAARAGEEVVREVDLAVSGPGELRLVVTATVKHGDDFTQSGIHVFAFNPSPENGGALTKGFVPATDPGGRTIVEVPARMP